MEGTRTRKGRGVDVGKFGSRSWGGRTGKGMREGAEVGKQRSWERLGTRAGAEGGV